MTYLQFSSSTCMPCRTLEPTMQKLRQNGKDVRKIMQESNLEMFHQYGIRNVPTVILLDELGREIKRWFGVQPYESYINY